MTCRVTGKVIGGQGKGSTAKAEQSRSKLEVVFYMCNLSLPSEFEMGGAATVLMLPTTQAKGAFAGLSVCVGKNGSLG